jgi:gas vesicle protein
MKNIITELFDNDIQIEDRVNFSVSYSQNRSMSVVTIQISRTSAVHALMFFYTRAYSLYDVIRYNRKQIVRMKSSSKHIKLINEVNKYILKKISKNDPTTQRKLSEVISMIKEDNQEACDARIESLKNDLRVARDMNKSLRDKIRRLRELLRSQNDRDKK